MLVFTRPPRWRGDSHAGVHKCIDRAQVACETVPMKELQDKHQKLLADAEECDLIANLAVEKDKRDTFRSLASQYRIMAEAVRKTIEGRNR